MLRSVSIVTVAILLALTASPIAATHDKTFWRGIAAGGFHPPAGESVIALSTELSNLLASPDPELRDDIAYSTLTSWIYQQKLLDAAAVRPLVATWLANLRVKIGGAGTDDVFRRSFSALMLSVVVARDNDAAFLERDEIRRILDGALAYLAGEHDVRGYLGPKGWAHSAAHTSDLLKFLGRSRQLDAADQARILTAVTTKLTVTPEVFVFGEDERMARALLSIVRRADFDVEGFKRWTSANAPKFPAQAALSVQTLRGFQNVKNLLTKLEVLLALADTRSANESAALDAVRAALKGAY